MELNQLKTFVAVAREGSITRASELLHLSQPAVSAHIKALEDELGLALFERTARGMTLTTGGQRLLAKAEQTLGAQQELVAEATRLTGRVTGKLRLGASSNANNDAVGRLLASIAERWPDVEVALQHGTSLEIVQGIRDGGLDAGFYNESGDPDRDLATTEVSKFEIYLVAPRGVVDAGAALDWKALAELPWIYPAASACCGRAAENVFKRHRIRPSRIISVDREQVTRTLIASGVGVGLLHADTAEAARARNEIDLIFDTETRVRVLFACLASRAEEPLLSAAASTVRNVVSS